MKQGASSWKDQWNQQSSSKRDEKRQNIQITKLGMKDMSTDPEDIKRTIKEYYE